MDADADTSTRSALWLCLQKLSNGLGVQREDLYEALQGELSELRDCWQVNMNNGPVGARRILVANLSAHIDRLQLPNIRQPLSVEDRKRQYRHAISVYFNLYSDPKHADLLSRDLTRRREWLESGDRGDLKVKIKTGQRYFEYAITQIEQQIRASGYTPIEAEPETKRTGDELDLRSVRKAREDGLIPRLEYLEEVARKFIPSIPAEGSAYFVPGCFWGEPGVGKTTLAHQILVELLKDTPSPYIATLRAGDEAQLRSDVTNLLMLEGLEPANWNDDYARAILRQRLSKVSKEPLRVRGVLIDNVDDEELITQLVPERLRVLCFVTMRKKPRDPNIAQVRIGGFTKTEALAFIRGSLEGISGGDARDLNALFRGRPLALDHVTRFLRESPEISAWDVIRTVAGGLDDALKLLANSTDASRNLGELYKMILAPLIQNDTVRTFLDSLLAIGGATGNIQRELLFHFVSSKYGGSMDRVHFRSAIQNFERLGLVHERANVRDNGYAETLLVMHPFTFEICREIRGVTALLACERLYYMYLANLGSDDNRFYSKDEQGDGKIMASILANAMEGARKEGLPPGLNNILCIDQKTWVALFRPLEAGGDDQERVFRYEIYSHGIYMLDYQTGIRRETSPEDKAFFFHAARIFHAALRKAFGVPVTYDSPLGPLPADYQP